MLQLTLPKGAAINQMVLQLSLPKAAAINFTKGCYNYPNGVAIIQTVQNHPLMAQWEPWVCNSNT